MRERFAERMADRLRRRRTGRADCRAGGVARATASGTMSSMAAAKISSAVCQPNSPIRATASGENRNWPNEPAAVPAPKASERHCAGTSLPKAASTMVKEQPARPKPISTPAESCSAPAWWRRPSAEPSRVQESADAQHPDGAEAVGDGAGERLPTPQSKFCSANASANTSRPHPWVDDSGVRKKPSEERGPKLISAIRQPQTTMTAGVRQDLAMEIDMNVSGSRRAAAEGRNIGPRRTGSQANLGDVSHPPGAWRDGAAPLASGSPAASRHRGYGLEIPRPVTPNSSSREVRCAHYWHSPY